MLISMPTGTSTIFGVFQAILALLANRTNSALVLKVIGNEKFASEIFSPERHIVLCCTAKEVPFDFGLFANRSGINGFTEPREHLDADGAPPSPRQRPDKELVSGQCPGLWASTPNWISPMPRYFFNTRIADELISDPEGEELRDSDRAWEIARAMIRELLKTEGAGALLNAVLEVTDDAGEIVLEFPFSEAILDFSDRPATRH
jgi:hypothetical protein